MALCSKDPPWIFVHIFRTGGTSVRRAVQASDLETFEIGGWHWSCDQVRQHCDANGLREWYDSAIRWAIVRNPFDWLASVYHYRAGAGNPVTALKQDADCAKFVERYCYKMRAINGAKPGGSNLLLTLNEFTAGCTNVLHLEELETVWPWVQQYTGITADLPRVNGSQREKGYRDEYTSAARRTVETFFGLDLRRFGYTY